MAASSSRTLLRPRVLLVGIGGPTCSGKTTLAKHLVSLLTPPSPSSPSSSSSSSSPSPPLRTFIIHQDDFCPPESKLVWNERVGSADWDDPDTSVDWPRLRHAVKHVREHGELPKGHSSHDALNVQRETTVANEIRVRYQQRLKDVAAKIAQGGEGGLVVAFLDGFLLYHDDEVRQQMDVRLFLRIGRDLLRERREARGGYVTAEGETWKDPPLYFDEILWPSHLKAHARLFQGGDVESGQTTEEARDIHIVEAQEPPGKGEPTSMDDVVAEGCEVLLAALEKMAAREAA
ncbi:P-loop containing nucleoside triphosphate hydrolase protein [Jaminaea rosea]|uniref:P-loop containing nucleoside triphosphate hydrolase protein n=1 Tax=Jaminaea rosea TaxID=1569628 RepID=A0A316UJV0_9BASI|nr:P-loop containing nucleoside triphosphate hydrolase protein [Jaminaea rosea]PWN25078.1 P-loop containing nucleoside triphosphate hydrolase protein [Jaminaea rosea]